MATTNNELLPFTNAHSHIFTGQHAPDYFLRTAIRNDTLALWVNRLVQRSGTRVLLRMLHWILKITSPNYRHVIERYIEFVQIGTSARQQDIFDKEALAYTKLGSYRIIALTQVLDFLDYQATGSNHKNIYTQVQEVVELKRNVLYQQRLFPFLGVDPRMQGLDLMEEWVKKYISKDKGFYGIKIYPAYGFFPFDIRFDPIWKWAAENQVPVMTHCTRGGSFYLGTFDSVVNAGSFRPTSLNPDSPTMPAILNRIASLVNNAGTSLKRNNKVWCNIFGHPENYRPVLEKYPNLKICLAHLGGSDEVNRSVPGHGKPPDYPEYLGPNWYPEVIRLMQDYSNVYSDISYTLSDDDAMKVITDHFHNNPLIERLMYGTDFYLTQQEEKGDEPDLIMQFETKFDPAEIQLLAYRNPDNFLRSFIHAPAPLSPTATLPLTSIIGRI